MRAERAAARRRARRNRAILSVAVAAGVVLITILIVNMASGGSKKASSTTTTTENPTVNPASAAGKPCVAVADPLPAGAPDVPVQVGPPPTKLVTQDLVTGTGPTVAPGATVTVNYIGVACSTGKIFDSSYSRGQTASFPLSSVIKGWTDGIPGMKVGGRRLLGIPSDQAYGASGSPPSIAPDEALWFVVEVTDTK